jgi:hypothetical protein
MLEILTQASTPCDFESLGVYQGNISGCAANEDFFPYAPQIDMAPLQCLLWCLYKSSVAWELV